MCKQFMTAYKIFANSAHTDSKGHTALWETNAVLPCQNQLLHSLLPYINNSMFMTAIHIILYNGKI